MTHTLQELQYWQSQPLETKIKLAQERIQAWYEEWIKYEIVSLDTDGVRCVTCRKLKSYEEEAVLGLTDREYIRDALPGQVYISFSGGKDSTVLLHIARQMYPDIEAVFVNTGLEYPEIQQFVKQFDNVTILTPEMRFTDVISKYGYPVISKEVSKRLNEYRNAIKKNCLEDSMAYKEFNGLRNKEVGGSFFNKEKWKPLTDMPIHLSHKCCDVMKKKPAKRFEKTTKKKAVVGTMASESLTRQQSWLKTGCNAFDSERPISQPLSHWTDQDVLQYIKENNLEIASVYGEIVEVDGRLKTTGCDRTGCIFCGFGTHIEKEPRFLRLKESHPKQYGYCINGGELVNGVWKPNKQGLGLGHIFDQLNEVYGEDFIRYK
jgi:3'-phosphoadenosine 5'-phosphosulfate sulfotransferase (PAPS reductase)/FAD synthetase